MLGIYGGEGTRSGGARREYARRTRGIRYADAWGEKYATNKTYGCWKMRAAHENRPIAGVPHVAHADTNNLGMLRVISVRNHKIE